MIHRRAFLQGAAGLMAAGAEGEWEAHFPSRLHQFVWRNWELANLDRMAAVVGCAAGELAAIGKAMGLPAKRRVSVDQLRRSYITVIRQNWRLLPEAQIIALLGWDSARFKFTLKEDDFLDVKLGEKPACGELRYHRPTEVELAACASLRKTITGYFPGGLRSDGEERFEFVRELSAPVRGAKPAVKAGVWSPRYIYSYFALYGDPLMEGDAAGLPDGYLQRAAMAGATGVWIQGVLNTLAPSKAFPEFGKGSETRLRNLEALVQRASKFGMKVYLYLNEPRAMGTEFFKGREELRGTKDHDVYAMCTSTAVVRDWLREAVAHVFKAVPELGGVFTITMSENHTNCFSHGGAWGDRVAKADGCPRCSKRTAAETIAELITAIRDGVREGSKTAEVISYDWGWGTPVADEMIPKLPKDSAVLSISEWSQPVTRGGVRSTVGEYSMSVIGPGPRAKRNWATAKRHGLRTIAKTQFNNTWEISAVPYIPVLPLVLEHAGALRAEGVDGVMASWTCGGYPSPNLRAAAACAMEPRRTDEEILREEAERIYSGAGAVNAVAAWKAFAEAFREFPYGVSIYIIPTQHGPANLFRAKATGWKPGMILFPHDAYKAWSGAYPPAVVEAQFRKMSAKWREGVGLLEKIGANGADARREVAIARTCLNHFESTANQLAFYLERDGGRDRTKMLKIVQNEIGLACSQYEIARKESTIGYEASNHYYYTPLDLVEKVLNCEQIRRQLETA